MPARATPLIVAVLTALAAVGGACSSSKGSEETDPTVRSTPASTTTTTTSGADPYAIPAVIDEAYVNRVLAALDQIDGDALRAVVSAGTVQFEAVDLVRAIYNDPEFDQQVEGLKELLESDLSKFKSPAGNRRTTVRRVVQASRECILAEVVVDFSEVVVSPPPPVADEFQFVVLERTQPGANRKRFNPTPWSIRHDEVATGTQAPGDKCDE